MQTNIDLILNWKRNIVTIHIKLDINWNLIYLDLKGPELQFRIAEIAFKPFFLGNIKENTWNTVTQNTHYFTDALLQFCIQGFSKYNHCAHKNVFYYYIKKLNILPFRMSQ